MKQVSSRVPRVVVALFVLMAVTTVASLVTAAVRITDFKNQVAERDGEISSRNAEIDRYKSSNLDVREETIQSALTSTARDSRAVELRLTLQNCTGWKARVCTENKTITLTVLECSGTQLCISDSGDWMEGSTRLTVRDDGWRASGNVPGITCGGVPNTAVTWTFQGRVTSSRYNVQRGWKATGLDMSFSVQDPGSTSSCTRIATHWTGAQSLTN